MLIVIQALLLLLALVGLTMVLEKLSGLPQAMQLFALVVILALGFVGLVGYAHRWGERVLFVVFLLMVLNSLAVWPLAATWAAALLLVSVAGFLLNVATWHPAAPPRKALPAAPQEPYSQVFEPEAKRTVTQPVAQFTPGRFVASRTSTFFHAPVCDWAKKIMKSRQVWFSSKEEAFQQGLKAHGCI